MLTERDHQDIEARGISKQTIDRQIQAFEQGFPPAVLDRPAIEGDGILLLNQHQVREYASFYEQNLGEKKIIKFVPASGAATRMFKDLFSWQETIRAGAGINALFRSHPEAKEFFQRMKEFAFWEDLSLVMYKDCLDADHLLANDNFLPLLEYLLGYSGLQYASLPKGLLKFHRYKDGNRAAMEEHLAEGAAYARQSQNQVLIHFTVSPEHEKKFIELFDQVRHKYETQYGVTYQLSFSVQKPSTDTIAVTLNNEPLREKGGRLVFRPGGHGALIENLNDLDGDIIFIKNIDNVVPDRLKEPTIRYKKVIAGVLLNLQQQVHQWLRQLDQGPLDAASYQQAVAFATGSLNIDPAALPEDHTQGSQRLKQLLDRPLRVCGMVKNQGEPGGGPFWVKDPNTGHASLQIIETSQINMNDHQQASILMQATHFNPVDLVCGIMNYKHQKFDLPEFVDPETGFISRKSKNGESLKALELPGLWNGAMAHWITIFVEVPLETFNPVKTINDLLRPQHL